MVLFVIRGCGRLRRLCSRLDMCVVVEGFFLLLLPYIYSLSSGSSNYPASRAFFKCLLFFRREACSWDRIHLSVNHTVSIYAPKVVAFVTSKNPSHILGPRMIGPSFAMSAIVSSFFVGWILYFFHIRNISYLVAFVKTHFI